MSLSDKIYNLLSDDKETFMKAFNRYHPEGKALVVNIEDVREAVKALKQRLPKYFDDTSITRKIIEDIDEIFGEKLI